MLDYAYKAQNVEFNIRMNLQCTNDLNWNWTSKCTLAKNAEYSNWYECIWQTLLPKVTYNDSGYTDDSNF